MASRICQVVQKNLFLHRQNSFLARQILYMCKEAGKLFGYPKVDNTNPMLPGRYLCTRLIWKLLNSQMMHTSIAINNNLLQTFIQKNTFTLCIQSVMSLLFLKYNGTYICTIYNWLSKLACKLMHEGSVTDHKFDEPSCMFLLVSFYH